MEKAVSMAEAKSHLSELVGRAAYRGEQDVPPAHDEFWVQVEEFLG